MSKQELVRRVATRQADAGLLQELRSLLPDTTDDIPLR